MPYRFFLVLRKIGIQLHFAKMKTLDRYRMTVYYFHALPDEYVSQKRQSSVYRRKGALIVEGELGYVICFQSIGEVSNTFPLTISVCDYNHFVSSFHETLRKLVLVNFCSPKIRVEHVAHHRNHMPPLFPPLHFLFIYSFSCFINMLLLFVGLLHVEYQRQNSLKSLPSSLTG